ncbi:PAN domain protein [Aphelenchoides bicaudatus]|nr:PAN domain protein [Aphelenchoides bicaudatus]
MRLFCALVLLLCANWSTAINPNELKPCFERYDGFKIVNASPFHSEWRMKLEEWCLEFCIRAASRCVSIVYDKHSHICHYFSVNGIEDEKITKHPKMVYFQIAERQCAERMQNKIEQEEQWRNDQLEQRNQQSTSISHSTTSEQFPTGQPIQEVEERRQSTTSEIERTRFETSGFETTPQMETTTVMEERESFPIRPSDETEMNEQATEQMNEREELELTTSRPIETQTKEDEDIDGDPMSFVRRFQFEKDGTETSNNDPLFPIQSDKIVVPVSTTPQIELATTPEEPETIKPSTVTTMRPSTTSTTTTQATTTRRVKTTQEPRTTPELSTLPKMIDPMTVRRPLPTKTEMDVEKKEPEMIEVRRSPQKLDHPKNTGKKPFAQKMEPEPEPTILQAEDDETMLADNAPVVDDCSDGMQEVWLAVENSQVNSSVRTTVIKVATQPLECMEACQTLFIGKHPCDSFTFIEPAKRCIFHSSHSGFQVKPSALNDFSTRAFRRFCYPESLSPFSDCAEFLAFRDYTLDYTPREIFENLPLGNEGLSACIELCVLSHDFRCKSATFNTKNGTCMIFDEHSLSKPTHFKTNSDFNRLYFENGCLEMKIPDSAVKQSKVQRVQPVLLDYRKLSKH